MKAHVRLCYSQYTIRQYLLNIYIMREILRFIGNGVHHSTMTMNDELFNITTDEKKELLRGIADVTAYIRKSNIAYGQKGSRRVYKY